MYWSNTGPREQAEKLSMVSTTAKKRFCDVCIFTVQAAKYSEECDIYTFNKEMLQEECAACAIPLNSYRALSFAMQTSVYMALVLAYH